MKRRQQKYLTTERQNIGELIIPQKIDKYELERYLAEQQMQHQQKQQQIQQQYQMNHHTIQPIHPNNQNQYFQHQTSLIKPNEYRSLKKWENGGVAQQYPSLNSHSATLKASATPTILSSSPLKKLQKNNVHILNNYNHTNSLPRDHDDDTLELPQEQIYSNHPDDEESNVEEDHYENFDDNYLNSLNHKINIQSTLPLTKPPTTATTLFNTNGGSKKSLQNNIKPHIVYVWLKQLFANESRRYDFI